MLQDFQFYLSASRKHIYIEFYIPNSSYLIH